METLPWMAQSNCWNSHLEQSLSTCPEPSRGKSEFQRFLQSPLIQELSNTPINIHTEVPFLFNLNQSTCYEGVIDFLAFSPQPPKALIIDWKTDLFEANDDPSPILQKLYTPQLSIYKQAVEKFHKITPRAFIFSTPLGKSIEC